MHPLKGLMTLIGNRRLLIHHNNQLIYNICVYNWLCICYEIPVVFQFHSRTHWIPVPFHWAPHLVSDHSGTLFGSLNIWVSPGLVVAHTCMFQGQKPYWTDPSNTTYRESETTYYYKKIIVQPLEMVLSMGIRQGFYHRKKRVWDNILQKIMVVQPSEMILCLGMRQGTEQGVRMELCPVLDILW